MYSKIIISAKRVVILVLTLSLALVYSLSTSRLPEMLFLRKTEMRTLVVTGAGAVPAE